MTAKEAYNEYRDYYKTNQWNGEDIRNYLKPNWIDFEEYNFEEFTDKVVNDDTFNARWANGCTRELSLLERYELMKKLDNWVSVHYKEPKTMEYMDNQNIPTRVIID